MKRSYSIKILPYCYITLCWTLHRTEGDLDNLGPVINLGESLGAWGICIFFNIKMHFIEFSIVE